MTKTYTLVNKDSYTDVPWELHKPGCKHLSSPRLRSQAANMHAVEAETPKAAAKQWIDSELREMGYTPDDVRIFPCCKDAPIKDEPKPEPSEDLTTDELTNAELSRVFRAARGTVCLGLQNGAFVQINKSELWRRLGDMPANDASGFWATQREDGTTNIYEAARS